MRSEIFKLTSTIAQLHAEKRAATHQVETLRAELQENGRPAQVDPWVTKPDGEAFTFPDYTSPSPVRTREVGGDDAHRIRAFAFPRAGIAEPSAEAEPVKTVTSPRKPTFGSTATADPSIDFQLPVETQHEYGGYAKELPSLFTMAAPLRCINFENTCGSCRGKVFVL